MLGIEEKHIFTLSIITILSFSFTGPFVMDNSIPLEISVSDPLSYTDITFNENEVDHQDLSGINNNAPWPVLGGDVQHTGRSQINASDNPGKIKKAFNYLRNSQQPIIDENGTIYLSNGNILSIYPNGTQKWNLAYSSTNYIPVLSSDGILYFGTSKNKFLAVNKENGSIIWSIDIECYSSAVIDENNTIYFIYNTIDDYPSLCALDPNGTIKWNKTLIGNIVPYRFSLHTPSIEENSIFISTREYVFCFYKNGSLNWMVEDEGFSKLSPPTIGPTDRVYIQDENELISLNKSNGKIEWRRKGGNGGIYKMPSIGPDGTIYSGYNSIIAYTPQGFPKWEWSQESVPISQITIDSKGTIFASYHEYFASIHSNGTTNWIRKLDLGIQQSSGIINKEGDIIVCGTKMYIIGKIKSSPPSNFFSHSGDSFVNLTWSYPEDDGGVSVNSYKLYKGNSSSNMGLHSELDPGTYFFNDTDVVNGEIYYYMITALNTEGESIPSEEIMDRPLSIPSSPRNVTLVTSDQSFRLTWDPPVDNGGTMIFRYDIYKANVTDEMILIDSNDEMILHYDDRDITIGETYSYQVTAVNIVGSSDPSEIISATYRTFPSSPYNLSARYGNGFIFLNWDPPISNGGSEIIGYKISKSSNIVDETDIILIDDPATTSYNDTNVINGNSYSYNVTAFTDVGESDPSNTLTRIPMTIPDYPMNLSVTPGDRQITISWEKPVEDGGSDILQYNLTRTHDELNETWFIIPVNMDLEYTDNMVQNGINYTYWIKAVNEVGESDPSQEATATPSGIPSYPLNMSVRSGLGFVHIYWNNPETDEGSPILEFNIYRDQELLQTISSINHDFNDTDVVDGNVYSYYLTSVNLNGESIPSLTVYGYPFEAPVVIVDPGHPENFDIQLVDDHAILTWAPPLFDGGANITDYRIYRKNYAEEWYLIDSVSSYTTSYEDDSLIPGISYSFYVTSFNGFNESERSNILNVTVPIKNLDDDDDDGGDNDSSSLILFGGIVIGFVLIVIIFLILYVKKRKGYEENNRNNEGFTEDEDRNDVNTAMMVNNENFEE